MNETHAALTLMELNFNWIRQIKKSEQIGSFRLEISDMKSKRGQIKRVKGALLEMRWPRNPLLSAASKWRPEVGEKAMEESGGSPSRQRRGPRAKNVRQERLWHL